MSDPLAAFGALQELGSEGREALLGYLEECEIEDGRSIFFAGEESAEMLLIVEGKVVLEAAGVSLGGLGPGELIGGLSLVAIGARECSARAAEGVRLLRLTRSAYLRLRQERPGVAVALVEGVLRGFLAAIRASLPEMTDAAGAS